MKIRIRKKFLFELSKIPADIRAEIEHFVFETFPANPSLKYWKNISALRQNSNLFKIPFYDYRIALRKDGQAFIFERIRHRHEIYRIQS